MKRVADQVSRGGGQEQGSGSNYRMLFRSGSILFVLSSPRIVPDLKICIGVGERSENDVEWSS